MKNSIKISIITFFSLMIFSMSAMPLVVSAVAKEPSGLVPCGNVSSGADVKEIQAQECNFNDLLALGTNIIKYLVLVSIPLAAISFAWAGFLYLSSGGSEDKAKKAKEIFWKVLTGFLFVLTAWLIVYALTSLLNKDFSLLK